MSSSRGMRVGEVGYARAQIVELEVMEKRLGSLPVIAEFSRRLDIAGILENPRRIAEKPPKSRNGHRTIAVDEETIDLLRKASLDINCGTCLPPASSTSATASTKSPNASATIPRP